MLTCKMPLLVKLASFTNEEEEIAIIELQGDLESRTSSSSDSQFIGDLYFKTQVDGTHLPILIIGHHILNGKVQNLEKPLAVMERKNVSNDNTEFIIKAIVTKKITFRTRPKPIIAVLVQDHYVMEAANHIAKGSFKCSQCSLKESYDYFGQKPPFNSRVVFKENCYVMKDPFTPSNKCQFLILGAKCSLCFEPVCQGTECSIFFTKRFCNRCIRDNLESFPIQIQSKFLRRQP